MTTTSCSCQCQKPASASSSPSRARPNSAGSGRSGRPIEIADREERRTDHHEDRIGPENLQRLRCGAARCLNSSAPPSSTLMMSSTPRVMPPGKSFALKRGVIEFCDDVFGDRVGQRAFEPVADLDADLALGRRVQQQHAVVLAALAELPAAEQAVGVVLDRIAVERLHRRDDDLVAWSSLPARRASRAATRVSPHRARRHRRPRGPRAPDTRRSPAP